MERGGCMCSLPLRGKTWGLQVVCQHPSLQLFRNLQVCASATSTHPRDTTCNIGAGLLTFPYEGSYPGTGMGESVFLSLVYDNGIIIIITEVPSSYYAEGYMSDLSSPDPGSSSSFRDSADVLGPVVFQTQPNHTILSDDFQCSMFDEGEFRPHLKA